MSAALDSAPFLPGINSRSPRLFRKSTNPCACWLMMDRLPMATVAIGRQTDPELELTARASLSVAEPRSNWCSSITDLQGPDPVRFYRSTLLEPSLCHPAPVPRSGFSQRRSCTGFPFRLSTFSALPHKSTDRGSVVPE